MKIHHLNCGTMHPFGLPRDDGTGGFLVRGYGVLHCLLVETEEGLVLVDTGWGLRDCSDPTATVRQFMYLCDCVRDPEETAVRQIAKLGLDPADVKHIILTHMHLDHAGGLPDFPLARVHLSSSELDACLHPRSYMERNAYRPEHWAQGPRWQPHLPEGERWFGLDGSPPVRIGEAKFILIPFTGHTRGHCAVALRSDGRWLLHCGDAYGYYRQIGSEPYTHPCGRVMERIITTGFMMRRRHWASLKNLLQAQGNEIQAFCSHDAQEFNAFTLRAAAG